MFFAVLTVSSLLALLIGHRIDDLETPHKTFYLLIGALGAIVGIPIVLAGIICWSRVDPTGFNAVSDFVSNAPGVSSIVTGLSSIDNLTGVIWDNAIVFTYAHPITVILIGLLVLITGLVLTIFKENLSSAWVRMTYLVSGIFIVTPLVPITTLALNLARPGSLL